MPSNSAASALVVLEGFRGLFSGPDQCAILLAPDQTVLDATPAARRLFGLACEGTVPLPDFPLDVENGVERALAGAIARVDLWRPDADGTPRAFEIIVQPIVSGDSIAAVLLQTYDITERRKREREGALLARIALAVGQTESISRAITATLQQICETTGWSFGEAWVPRVINDVAVLERRGTWSRPDPALEMFAIQAGGLRFQSGEGMPGTVWASKKHLWVEDLRHFTQFTRGALAVLAGLHAAVAIPLVEADGEVAAVLVFFMRDVASGNAQFVQLASAVAAPLARLVRQKQVEEAHRLAEARLSGMVSIAADAIISIDAERRITMFNWGAERIFGYRASEAMGQLIDILLPEELRSRHAAHIVGFAHSLQTTRRMGERSRIVGLRKNGDMFPAEASISRFLTDGEWVYTVILRDISERVRTEEELRVLAEQAREAAASRDQVLALVSHDLRNPLNTISICLSGLRDDPPPTPEMADGLVVLAQESLALMSRMIQDLLDVASIEAGKLSLERQPQPVLPLLLRAVEMHAMLAEQHKLELRIDNASCLGRETEGRVVDIDGERILQVLSNLIGNAIKFTDPGGQVIIFLEWLPNAVQIAVRDTGYGIPIDAIPHVFDRFWHARRGAAQPSTGLGLAIARGLVEAHEGRIWVESSLGEGSTFYFTLPLALGSVR